MMSLLQYSDCAAPLYQLIAHAEAENFIESRSMMKVHPWCQTSSLPVTHRH